MLPGLAPPIAAFLLFALAGPVPGVPAPPGGRFESEITAVVAARAAAQMKPLLEEMERDLSQPESVKAEIRKKASRLRVAVYTFPGTIDDLAAFYAGKVPGVSFLFTEREIGKDLAETALAGGFALAPSLAKEWQGKKGRSARWARSDGSLEIDIEDHLIDPRDGRVTRQGVVMVTGTN